MTFRNTPQLNAQFNRAHISEGDFKEAGEYLGALRGRRSLPVKRALLLAAIIAYSRPFTQNEKVRNEKATPQLSINPAQQLSPEDFLLHSKLLSLRNQALAHSEFSRKPIGRVMATAAGYVTASMPFDVLSERIDRERFQSMCSQLASYCRAKLLELNHKLGPKAQ